MNATPHTNKRSKEEYLTIVARSEFERFKGIFQKCRGYCHLADASGATLLHYSAQHNNANLTKHLLDNGCDANAEDTMGNTPLTIAITKNHKDTIRVLLASGADVLKLNKQNKSALHLFGTQHRMKFSTIQLILRALFEKCSTTEEMAKKMLDAGCHLYHAAAIKNADIIEYMLERADLNTCGNVHPTNKTTTMHVAAILDDSKSVKVLLKHGADPNTLDNLNASPLYYLYHRFSEHSSQKIEILRILLSRGASTTSCTSAGVFQAHGVLIKGNRQAIRALMDSGLDFNVRDRRRDNAALHYLAHNFDAGVIEELKLHDDKFDVDARDRSGLTPLHIAAAVGNVAMVRFLLRRGAGTEFKHLDGVTPLCYAYAQSKAGFEKEYCVIGEMLLRRGADPQTCAGSDGTVTIFDEALVKNDVDRIKPVLAHLALVEKRGTEIVETIRAKIESHEKLREYFDRCRRLLEEKVAGRVRLFDLLSGDKRKMARYLNNKVVVRRLDDKSYKRKMQRCWYFHNDLGRRYSEGRRYKKLKDKAAKVICRMFRNRVDKTHLIIERMTEFLDDQSLRRLCNAKLVKKGVFTT